MDETIVSTCLGEVALYEAPFHACLRFPFHPIIRKILYFYNIFPTQLVPNAWRSLVYVTVVWWAHKFILSLNEFRSLFTLYRNQKPDFGWIYFKLGHRRLCSRGILITLMDGRRNSSSFRETTGSSPQGYLGKKGLQGSEVMGHPSSVPSYWVISLIDKCSSSLAIN